MKTKKLNEYAAKLKTLPRLVEKLKKEAEAAILRRDEADKALRILSQNGVFVHAGVPMVLVSTQSRTIVNPLVGDDFVAREASVEDIGGLFEVRTLLAGKPPKVAFAKSPEQGVKMAKDFVANVKSKAKKPRVARSPKAGTKPAPCPNPSEAP